MGRPTPDSTVEERRGELMEKKMDYPYIASQKAIQEVIEKLRRSVPQKIDIDYLKKVNIAPKNESYLIGILKFMGIVDDENNPTEKAREVFAIHRDEEFGEELSKIIRDAYKEIFDLNGEEAWNLPLDDLISYFRQASKSSGVVGERQAKTFSTLAEISGKRKIVGGRKVRRRAQKASSLNSSATKKEKTDSLQKAHKEQEISMCIKIEINIPGGQSKEVYDDIFRSIKENLM